MMLLLPRPSVIRLLFVSSPAEIARLIALAIVNAVQSVPRRALADIVQKALGVGKPLRMHCYASAPISMIVGRFRVSASALCGIIGSQLRCDSSASTRAMLQVNLAREIAQKTPATARVPTAQIHRHGDDFCSAIAFTQEGSSASHLAVEPQNNQSLVAVPGNINRLRHTGISNGKSTRSKAFDTVTIEEVRAMILRIIGEGK